MKHNQHARHILGLSQVPNGPNVAVVRACRAEGKASPKGHMQCYRLQQVPDRNRMTHLVTANEDVATAAFRANEQFLRIFANVFSGGVVALLRFFLNPNKHGNDAKERLNTFLLARTSSDCLARTFSALMESGPLARFHKLTLSNPADIPWKRFKSASHIVRCVTPIRASVRAELNPFVPARHYYSNQLFKGREDYDVLPIDRICGELDENLLVDIAICAKDIAPEYIAISLLLDRFEKINRTFDEDCDDFAAPKNYLAEDSSAMRPWRERPKHRRHKDPIADNAIDALRDLRKTLAMPHLEFHIRVLAETDVTCRLVAAVLGESAFIEGSYRLLSFCESDPFFGQTVDCARECLLSPVPVHERLFEAEDIKTYAGLEELASVATVAELTTIFRLPLASYGATHCIPKDTDPPGLAGTGTYVAGYSPVYMKDGDIDLRRSVPRGAALLTGCKHEILTGAPGSGKSTFILNYLLTLVTAGIPFIVFESAKKEYRSIKLLRDHPEEYVRALAENVAIYTVGNEVSPLCLNLCERPSWMTLDDAIADTVRCFEGSMAMAAPLPELIREALETLHYGGRGLKRMPTMANLYDYALLALRRKRYAESTTADIGGAIDSRLGNLVLGHAGRVFQCMQSCPSIPLLAESFSVLELDDLSTEQAALVIMSILTRVGKYLKSLPWNGNRPRLVIVIEEAHRVIGNDTDAHVSEVSANSKAFATETICRILAEYRGLGVGVVIVDQLASVLAPQVIKIPCTHIAFKQVDAHEREIVASAMGLNSMQADELARLAVGECFFTSEGYYEPIKIQTVDLFRRLSSCE